MHRLWHWLSVNISKIGFLLATAKSMLLDKIFRGGFATTTHFETEMAALDKTDFTPEYKAALKRKRHKQAFFANSGRKAGAEAQEAQDSSLCRHFRLRFRKEHPRAAR